MCQDLDKKIEKKVMQFCNVSGEEPSNYGGYSVLSRKDLEGSRFDAFFINSWRHMIPVFEAFPGLDKIVIFSSSHLSYEYFVLPEKMNDEDMELMAGIYNDSFRRDPKYIYLDAVEIRAVFDDELLSGF